MLQVIVGVLLFLYLLTLPIRARVTGFLDIPHGNARVEVRVLFIKAFKAEGLTEHFSFTSTDFIFNLKNKQKRVHVEMKRSTIRRVIDFIKNIDLSPISNLDVKDVTLTLKYGQADAMYTAIVLSVVRAVFYSTLSALKSNQNVEVSEEFVPLYGERALKIDFCGIFSLSVADIIYGYLRGKIRKRRKKQGEKQ